MPRISIEVTDEEHKYYKTIATLQGLTLKEMVMSTLQKTYKDEYKITLSKTAQEEVKESVEA